MDYTPEEKKKILSQYLAFYQVNYQPSLLSEISKKVAPVPREIHNLLKNSLNSSSMGEIVI